MRAELQLEDVTPAENGTPSVAENCRLVIATASIASSSVSRASPDSVACRGPRRSYELADRPQAACSEHAGRTSCQASAATRAHHDQSSTSSGAWVRRLISTPGCRSFRSRKIRDCRHSGGFGTWHDRTSRVDGRRRPRPYRNTVSSSCIRRRSARTVWVGFKDAACPGAYPFASDGIDDELDFRGAHRYFLRVSHRSTCKRRVTPDYRLLLVTMVWRGDENWRAARRAKLARHSPTWRYVTMKIAGAGRIGRSRRSRS